MDISVWPRHRERGAAAVEFALVVPVLFLLICGIVDISTIFNYKSQLQNAANISAREYSMTRNATDAKSRVVSSVSGVTTTQVSVVDPDPGRTEPPCPTTRAAGSRYAVKVTITTTRQTPTLRLGPYNMVESATVSCQ